MGFYGLYRVNATTQEFRCEGGSDINQTIQKGIWLAGKVDMSVQFKFNGIVVTVRADSNSGLIYRDWQRATNNKIPKKVGPYPPKKLSPKERAHDRQVDREAELKRKARLKKATERWEHDVRRLELALKKAPPATWRDEKGWLEARAKNSKTRSGRMMATFIEEWARLMEGRLAKGESFDKCARKMELLAGARIDLSGASYGLAIQILGDFWHHGDALRRWHNSKFGIDESAAAGRTVDPAMLAIS